MKLYELPKRTYFKIEGEGDVFNSIYFLDHIDGMYSYCTDKEGNVLHIGASTEVVRVDSTVVCNPIGYEY